MKLSVANALNYNNLAKPADIGTLSDTSGAEVFAKITNRR